MNYIRHLNAFFQTIKGDDRLTSAHVSLYLALFQYWNYNRFQNPFPIFRHNIMQLSKIGSKNTYHKCMKELHTFNYVMYHTAVTRYQPVKVSIIRLDIKQPITSYRQLDLFTSTRNETQQVPILTGTSPKNDTAAVPDLGHILKPNILKTESNRHSGKIKPKFESQESQNAQRVPVSNSIHIEEVRIYFTQSNYPSLEADKFYNHYKALGWKISNQPIADWQALANKWMLNARHCEAQPKQSPEPQKDLNKEIAYLHQRHQEGHDIFNQILQEHFDHLNLQLTPEVKTEAVKRRIDSLIGSNHHSINKLLQAYQEGDVDSPYILKDQSNLVLLAQRIAVLNHFAELVA